MRYALVALFAFLFATDAPAATLPTESDAIASSQAAIGNVLPKLTFTDTNGRQVALDDYRGRPLLVSLVYTGCADVCPTIIDNLHPAVEIAQAALGDDSFSVVTIGFDPRNDTPARMRSFARSRGVDLPNWNFLSGSATDIDQLIKSVGFVMVPSAAGFDHMAQVSIIDTDGRIYQQIYGGIFEVPAVVEPLKDLVFGRRKPLLSLSGIADRVKLFCTVYNPNTGRYYFNYSLFIGIAIGLACLALVLFWLVREFFRSGGPRKGAA